MAFTRSATTVQPVELSTLSPSEVERRIIQGVRRFATRQDNWASADKNTPFLGTITGMGIESANLVDITMFIERQFLTRKTKRVFEEGDDRDPDGGLRARTARDPGRRGHVRRDARPRDQDADGPRAHAS